MLEGLEKQAIGVTEGKIVNIFKKTATVWNTFGGKGRQKGVQDGARPVGRNAKKRQLSLIRERKKQKGIIPTVLSKGKGEEKETPSASSTGPGFRSTRKKKKESTGEEEMRRKRSSVAPSGAAGREEGKIRMAGPS